MDWISAIRGFKAYLKLEKGLSENSIQAYSRDISKLAQFLKEQEIAVNPMEIHSDHLNDFIIFLGKLEISPRSQARIISGLKAFYRYLLLEDMIENDPTEFLESPKIPRTLPTVLTVEEIDKILDAIDMSKEAGHRNRAMIETLYGCGLRVTELLELKISGLYLDIGFIKVIGKGDKERIVPINQSAAKAIKIYTESVRKRQIIQEGMEDFLFLNRRGKPLSRVMVFMLVKELAKEAGLSKNVSPHTFRHSFATHLYEGGADLRAIQDMLGHESITTTEIYSKVNQQYLRDTMIQFHPRFN